jgi:hypothetical protein
MFCNKISNIIGDVVMKLVTMPTCYDDVLSGCFCMVLLERDWSNSRSFYDGIDLGEECGVVAETMFYVLAENKAKFC